MADLREPHADAPADNPPPRVLGAARRAFVDAERGAAGIRPVHDSWDEARVVRTLAFRADDVSLVLTCRIVPGGVWLEGGFLGAPRAPRLVLQRPARPSLRIDPMSDLRIRPVRVPRGLANFVAEYEHDGAPTAWRSDWLRL
jgi:hypothetical protein